GSADCFSLVFRCRWPGNSRGLGTPLFDSAFVAVGLKLCDGGRQAAQCAAPTVFLCGDSGRRVQEAAPYGPAPTATCSAEPGAVVEPQQRQFLQTQGPVARMEPQKAAQILRAGNFAQPRRYVPPVMGVLGG